MTKEKKHKLNTESTSTARLVWLLLNRQPYGLVVKHHENIKRLQAHSIEKLPDFK